MILDAHIFFCDNNCQSAPSKSALAANKKIAHNDVATRKNRIRVLLGDIAAFLFLASGADYASCGNFFARAASYHSRSVIAGAVQPKRGLRAGERPRPGNPKGRVGLSSLPGWWKTYRDTERQRAGERLKAWLQGTGVE